MARRAVLAYRGMLPQHRSAHLGVAGRTGFVNRAPDAQRLHVADRAVRVVARRARHLALAHRHVRHRALGLGDLHPVTRGTHRRLRALHELAGGRLRLVDAVTRDARQVPRLVHAALPAGVRASVVTRETRLTRACGRQRLQPGDIALRLVVDMRLSWPVAALATERRRWRAGIMHLAMSRALERVTLSRVTQNARVAPGVAGW